MSEITIPITADEDDLRRFVGIYSGLPFPVPSSRIANAIAAALPPTEPQGLGAVVKDGLGELWVKTEPGWWICSAMSDGHPYADLPAPITVLSEGWTPDE